MVHYSDVWYHGTEHMNSKQFSNQMNSHDLNTKLVHYSDPYCMYNMDSAQGRTVLKIHPGQIVFFPNFHLPPPRPRRRENV